MHPFNNLAENKILPVFFKLLHDTLFLLLLFFAATLAAESLLPGIISRYSGIHNIIALVLGNIFLITLAARFLKIENSSSIVDKKMIFLISFFGIALILNGLLKMNIFLNLAITLSAIVIAYLAYLIISEEKEN